MATVIGFSARKGDNILVEESVEDVRGLLLPGALPADGLCQLTRVAAKLEMHFEPLPVHVNPTRIAYLHAEIEL